ncbi:(2Fe-2S)-binding protein [Zavarzinia compransoris]|uniref:(2Fe-2S)-binding protein n=1 Tax=Zavarzinia compransoris TaxID=1264899 RepID=UPI001AAC50ED|nr:(2Fe-2S)-binding protein [Zavarzinia compransoris]
MTARQGGETEDRHSIMYVCNCNGLNRRSVNQAIADGARTTAAVFRDLDCRPQCGKCVGEVKALITACRHRDACGNAAACATQAPHFLVAAE